MLVTWLVTNIQILSPTHLVSNIRYQHRCNLSEIEWAISVKNDLFPSVRIPVHEFTINCYDQIKMNVLELNTAGLHQFRIAAKQDDTSIVPPYVTSFYSIVQELRDETILKRTEPSKKP